MRARGPLARGSRMRRDGGALPSPRLPAPGGWRRLPRSQGSRPRGSPHPGAAGAGGRRDPGARPSPLCSLPAPADRTLSSPRCRRPARPGPPLQPPALALSSARLCLPAQPCLPCLRVRLALPAAGTGRGGGAGHPPAGGGRGRGSSSQSSFLAELGDVRGLQLNFLELGSNRASWLQVWQRHRAPVSSPVSSGWTVGPDGGAMGVPLTPSSPHSGRCSSTASRWRADSRSSSPSAPSLTEAWPSAVATWLLPSHLVRLGGTRRVSRLGHQRWLTPICSTGPVFTHVWVPEARAIEVWVPEGPALMVRLCHQLALECEELSWPFHQQVTAPALLAVPILGWGLPVLPAS